MLAVIKKINLSPPRRLQLSPQGCVPAPLSTTFPWSNSTPTGQGALPRKRLEKTKIQEKKIKTTPAKAGEGSGSPRVKNPAGSPPENAKGITESPQSKAPTAREGSGGLMGNGSWGGKGSSGIVRRAPEGPTCSRIRHQRDHAMVTATSLLSQTNTFYIFIYIIII